MSEMVIILIRPKLVYALLECGKREEIEKPSKKEEDLIELSIGEVLGKKCIICRRSVYNGGSFIICPNCSNIYCIECVKELDLKQCINCGFSLEKSISLYERLQNK